MRMRPMVLSLVAAVAVVTGVTTAAAPAAADCANGQDLVGCPGGGGGGGPGGGGPGGGGGGGAGFPLDFEYYFDEEGEGVGSAPGSEVGCWGIRAVPEGQGTTWDEAVAEQSQQGENGVLWGNCRIEDTIDPAMIARALWERTVRPPAPTPLSVEPGKALTGLRAYLEIGGESPAHLSVGTPIGPAAFIMTPRYVVSWGDGASVESTSQGVPYPGGPGEVSHVYIDDGATTITVQAFWHTTWSLAGLGGDLPELPIPTEASLDLAIEERQVTTN